jgi:regulator of sigma E protease
MRGKNSAISVARMIPVFSSFDNKPEIGISMDEIGTAKLAFFTALIEGLRLTWSTTKNTANGLYTLISDGIHGKGNLSSVTGPVGMVGIVGDAYRFGFVYLVSFAALISVNLAIINLLPFPALDGGRLFFLLIEKIKGSRMNPKVVNTANMIGFCLLILLMIVITYHDVAHLF